MNHKCLETPAIFKTPDPLLPKCSLYLKGKAHPSAYGTTKPARFSITILVFARYVVGVKQYASTPVTTALCISKFVGTNIYLYAFFDKLII